MARLRWQLWAAVVAGAGLAVSGCGEQKPVSSANSQFKPAEAGDQSEQPKALAGDDETVANNAVQGSGTNSTKGVKKPAPISVDKLDADSLPDGPPEKIVAFMRQLEGFEPRGVTRDAQRSDLIRFLHLIIEAGDRVLAEEDTDPALRVEAAQLKLQAVMELARRGEPKSDQLLTAYCQRLKKDKDPNVSRIGRTLLFSISAAKLQNGEGDEQALVDEFAELLGLPGEDPENVTFVLGAQFVNVLEQMEKNDAAIATVGLLKKHYKDSKDKAIQEQLKLLTGRTRMMEFNVRGKWYALLADKPEPTAADDLVEAMKTFLTVPKPDRVELEVASQSADILERTENYKHARQVIDLLATKFKGVADEKLAEDVREIVDSGKKRLGLIGKPLVVTGQTLDGQPFDAKALRGKVVLVDFWATWCTPCLQEIPNIAHYYELYKDKGFEVIGYNLDDDPEKLDRFFANQKLPWATVTSNDPEKLGFSSPIAEACGVRSIPFLVLLDQKGNVIALHTRGDKLGEKLAELLGPVENAKPAPGENEAP